MKSIIFLLFALSIYACTEAQSLSPERVAKIKMATARITMDGIGPVGTGFFIDRYGGLLTNWHVFKHALIFDEKGTFKGLRKIFIELYSNEKIEFLPALPSTLQSSGELYDFWLLRPAKNQFKIYNPLKVGDFKNLDEGQEVYTCGFPLGMQQPFLSKGIVSTIYEDTAGKASPVTTALIDITLNPGNSGGAIVKVGKTVEEDEVLGIATFIKTQLAGQVDELVKTLGTPNASFGINGVSMNHALAMTIKVLESSAVGISGCVSINHFLSTYKSLGK